MVLRAWGQGKAVAGPREGDVGSRGGGSTCGYSTKLTQTGGGARHCQS